MKCFLLTALVLSTTEAFQILLGPPAVSTKRASPKVSLILLRGQSTTEESPKKNRVSIEYCLGCRWDLKAFWYAQEILTTFSEDLDAVTIIPSRNTKGNFAVRFNHDEELLWDRKEKGAFPETKVLKQKIRDLVAPELHLGHSDTEERQSQDTSGDIFASEWVPRGEEDSSIQIELAKGEAPEPSVRIHYCTGCRWLLRAAYCAQELMSTFKDEINSVTLVPSKPPARGGRFTVELNGEEIFDRKKEGRFPEVKELKQSIRDRLAPGKDLGHSDTKDGSTGDDTVDFMDDDEAEAARRMYGVA